MYTVKTLDVIGYRNEVLPCTFFQQEQATDHIAVLFPGFGYTAQMPLMYYPGRLLIQFGADVFLVGYNYSERPDFYFPSPDDYRSTLQEFVAFCRKGEFEIN